MQIQVRINVEGTLRNQRFAFANRFTLVSELLQNARRAGATQVDIYYSAESNILQVSDNGCGIDDFQKLLSFNESGWDHATCAEEHAFGVGFSKCLYGASRCVVVSGCQWADFETRAALAQMPIDVRQLAEADVMPGTHIELHGVELADLETRIEGLCMGFPIPVRFNGKLLSRRFAEDKLDLMPSPIGQIHLTGTVDGEHSSHMMAFLQGFCVLNTAHGVSAAGNVVHLDSHQFMARLPDRDRLIDEDLHRTRIDDAIRACWHQVLKDAKARLAPEQFANTFYGAMCRWGHLELLNDMDALPCEPFGSIIGYPVVTSKNTRDYVRSISEAPTREAIENGTVTLVDLDRADDQSVAIWMLARAKGHLVFCRSSLDHRHWVQGHLRYLEGGTAKVQAVGEQARTTLEGRWISPTVILCEAVQVQVGGETAQITDKGVFHGDALYIPAGETSGDPVRQASYFTDENDQFLSNDLDADFEALTDLIRRLRCVDPVQTLDSLMHTLRLGKYPLLQGKTFLLSLGAGSQPGHLIDLVE